MKQRLFILISISLMLIFNFCAIKPKISPPEKPSEPSTARYRLVWNDDPTSTMTIAWDQLRGEKPVVHYGEKDFRRRGVW